MLKILVYDGVRGDLLSVLTPLTEVFAKFILLSIATDSCTLNVFIHSFRNTLRNEIAQNDLLGISLLSSEFFKML